MCNRNACAFGAILSHWWHFWGSTVCFLMWTVIDRSVRNHFSQILHLNWRLSPVWSWILMWTFKVDSNENPCQDTINSIHLINPSWKSIRTCRNVPYRIMSTTYTYFYHKLHKYAVYPANAFSHGSKLVSFYLIMIGIIFDKKCRYQLNWLFVAYTADKTSFKFFMC